jgi:AraC-like DNA-binding protein
LEESEKFGFEVVLFADGCCFRGGLLFRAVHFVLFLAQVALAWLRYRPLPVIPTISARKLSQLKDSCASSRRASSINCWNFARSVVLHSSLELNETAYLLGYEDANSFFRAFHQWEGTSPGEWRAAHAHRGSSNHAPASVV